MCCLKTLFSNSTLSYQDILTTVTVLFFSVTLFEYSHVFVYRLFVEGIP